MKQEEMFSKDTFEKYAEMYTKQSQFSAGASRVTANGDKLSRWKMESNSDSLMVVPVFIHLPFSLVTGEVYAAPTPILGTVRWAIGFIKQKARQFPVAKEALIDLLGDNAEKIIWETEGVSDAEFEAFKGLRQPLVYGATVMSVRPMDSKYAWGTSYRVNVKYDAESGSFIDDNENSLVYKLHCLEQMALAIKIKQLHTENENAGVAKRNDKEMKVTTDGIWDGMCIKNPYTLGTTRVLIFNTDRNYEVTEKIKTDWGSDIKSVRRNEVYIKANRNVIESFTSVLGGKYDRYDDFILIKMHVPEFTDDTKKDAAKSISRSGAASEDAIEKQLPKFIEAYTEFRSDIDRWDEKVIMRSAFEYRTISDEAISAIFKNTIPMLSAELKTREVIDAYSDVIKLIDTDIADNLLMAAMSDDVAEAGDLTNEFKSAPVVDENVDGYGGDTLDARPDNVLGDDSGKSALMDAIAEEE